MNDEKELQKLNKILQKINELSDFQVDHLPDVNFKGTFDDTPLHVAVVWGDIEASKILLKFNADIDAIGEHGYTPLHEAVEKGNYDVVALLIKNGCSLTITNDDGLTAKQLAELMKENKILNLLSKQERRRY